MQIFTVAELLKGGKPYLRMMKEGRALWGNARPSHNLAKVGVEGSNPFARSNFIRILKYLELPAKVTTVSPGAHVRSAPPLIQDLFFLHCRPARFGRPLRFPPPQLARDERV